MLSWFQFVQMYMLFWLCIFSQSLWPHFGLLSDGLWTKHGLSVDHTPRFTNSICDSRPPSFYIYQLDSVWSTQTSLKVRDAETYFITKCLEWCILSNQIMLTSIYLAYLIIKFLKKSCFSFKPEKRDKISDDEWFKSGDRSCIFSSTSHTGWILYNLRNPFPEKQILHCNVNLDGYLHAKVTLLQYVKTTTRSSFIVRVVFLSEKEITFQVNDSFRCLFSPIVFLNLCNC